MHMHMHMHMCTHAHAIHSHAHAMHMCMWKMWRDYRYDAVTRQKAKPPTSIIFLPRGRIGEIAIGIAHS